jgi:predicted DNA binding CopG/RHH family protein
MTIGAPRTEGNKKSCDQTVAPYDSKGRRVNMRIKTKKLAGSKIQAGAYLWDN